MNQPVDHDISGDLKRSPSPRSPSSASNASFDESKNISSTDHENLQESSHGVKAKPPAPVQIIAEEITLDVKKIEEIEGENGNGIIEAEILEEVEM